MKSANAVDIKDKLNELAGGREYWTETEFDYVCVGVVDNRDIDIAKSKLRWAKNILKRCGFRTVLRDTTLRVRG
jgi:hypothetical protein